jgi:hypothetical protein
MFPTASTNSFFVAEFDPRSGSSTGLESLPFPLVATGNPNCTTLFTVAADNKNNVAACAIAEGNNMVGFAFDPGTGFSAPSSSSTAPLSILSTGPFLGNPNCATVFDGTGDVICAVVEGTATSNKLVAIAFNPVTQALAGSAQILGPSPSGNWTGNLSCTSPNEPTGDSHATVLCALTTSTNEVFGINFDPRTNTKSPFSPSSVFTQSGTLGVPSCVTLAVDNNQISCGIATGSNSFAFNVAIP